MPITILRPQPAPQRSFAPTVAGAGSDSESESGGVDIHGDVAMDDADDRGAEVLTPGTVITSDPKWMR
jgi:hypothetical protein